MYANPESREMWSSLDSYFSRPDTFNIQSAVRRWPGIVSLGPLWVADRLDNMLPQIKQMASSGVPNEVIVQHVLSEAGRYIEMSRELARLAGKDAGKQLLASYMTAADEDEQTLYAITLEEGMIGRIEPFQRKFIANMLRQEYRSLVGTGCRFATAVVLDMLGEPNEINEFRRLRYPSKPQMIEFAILDVAFKGTVIGGLFANQKGLPWTRK